MPRRILYLAAIVGLHVFLVGAASEAQSPPRGARVEQALAPNAGERGLRPPPLRAQPRFKVEAISVHAIDESGPDWLGSDEIFAIVTTATSGMRTETLADFDTGESKAFTPGRNCMAPLADPHHGYAPMCDMNGAAGPISFRVELYEQDREPINFCPSTSWGWSQCDSDDLIDRKTITLLQADLLAAMPNVGDTSTRSAHMGGPCGYVDPAGPVIGCGPATGPEYTFTYRVTRLADHFVLASTP